MKRILVATDFSARSDRALQRASLLARQFGAALVLVAVIDDDQPQRLLEAERREAAALFDDLARTARESAGVECEARVEFGEPFQRIVDVAENIDADLVVLGPHRRQVLRDIFVGTTGERTIRHSQRPVLMANAIPAPAYDRIIVATDFSDSSVQAVQSLRRLGFLDTATIVIAHACEALFQGVIVRSAMTMREWSAPTEWSRVIVSA